MIEGNLEKVMQHGKRADSIVKNMLLHSRESGGEHRAVDLNSVVEESSSRRSRSRRAIPAAGSRSRSATMAPANPKR
jgi:two-component system, NtrC family, sensor kinase